MENSTQKEDEKYIEKVRQKMQFCLSMLQDTLFSDNWFINPESNVLKPFLHKSDLETYIKRYKSTKSQALKKIIFDHMMWFAVYVVSFKFTKYYKICKDPQEWISFALEHLWQCIDNYSSDKNTSFETYFINDITFRSKGYIEYMCNYDGTMTIGIRRRVSNVISNIINLNLTFNQISSMPESEFYSLFQFDKYAFMQAVKLINIESTDAAYSTDTNDTINNHMLDPYTSCFSEHVDTKICVEQISNIVKTKYAKSDRDYIIWKEYIVNGNKSLQEIGDQYGLTRERIRQIIWRIHKRLRNNPKVKEIFEAYNL